MIRYLMPIVVACAMLSLYCNAAGNPAEDMHKKMERERKRKDTAFARKMAAEMFANKPLLRSQPNSLSLYASGIPELQSIHNLDDHWLRQVNTVGLSNGVLYYTVNQVGDDEGIWFYADTSAPLAQRIKDKLESLKLLLAMNAEYKPGADAVNRQAERVRGVRTAAELDMLDWIYQRGILAEGPLALNPNQFGLLLAAHNTRMKAADALAKLVTARTAANAAETDKKVLPLFDQMQSALKLAEKEGNLFSPDQRIALGYDPDPKRPPRMGGFSAGASASAGNFDEGKHKEREAKYEEMKTKAKVRFTLKGKPALHNPTRAPAYTSAGTIWVWQDRLPDNSGITVAFALEPRTWAEEKAEYMSYYKNMTEEKLKASSASTRANYELLKRANSMAEYVFGAQVETLSMQTGSVPPETQERLKTLIDAATRAADELVMAYNAALEKPHDAALQRKLFDAFRTAQKTHIRGLLLSNRSQWDKWNLFKDLPWVLTLEQSESLGIEPTTGVSNRSSVRSGPEGVTRSTLVMNARPQGKLQYVGINTDNVTVEDVAGQIEEAAIQYFRQRDIQINVDPAVYEKGVRGTIEGTSIADLVKGLALRSGITATQDPKNPNIWHLKP